MFRLPPADRLPMPLTWSVLRDGHRLTCAVVTLASGHYLLRLTHNDKHLVDERCATLASGCRRSAEALTVFLSRGWLQEHNAN